jgi:translocation and assembly module TamB
MLRAAARALATGVVFLLAVGLGLVVHVGIPPMQRVVVARVNGALAPVFAGKLTIDRVGSLGLASVGGVDAHMDDPDGKTVIRATGIAGRVSTAALVRSLVSGDIAVGIPEASLTSAEVSLDADDGGTLRIAKAFLPRTPSNPASSGPGVRLSMPRVHLGHVSVHVDAEASPSVDAQASPSKAPAGLPPLDADADAIDGSLAVAPGHVDVDVTRARWVARNLPGGVGAQGDAVGHLALPSPEGRELGLHLTTEATVATIAVKAGATFDGGQIDATLDVPAAMPDQVRAIVPSWPPESPLSMHAEAHGALPRLTFHAHASLDASSLDVDGPVTVVPRLQASVHVSARRIDARTLVPASSPPHTDLGAAGDVSLTTKPDGAMTVNVAMDLEPGTIASVPTPTAAVTGEMTRAPDPGGGITATAKAVVHEPGAPTVVTVRLAPKKRSMSLSFQVEANSPDLAQVPALRQVAKGRALAQATGTVDLGAEAVDASLSVAGEEVEAFGASAQAARLEVHATGALRSPALAVQLGGEGLEVWRLQCRWLRASSQVGIEGGLTLRDVDLDTRAAEQRVHANARFVHIAGEDVRVEDAVVKGFGAPIEGTLTSEPGRLYLRARSGELDLARIARFLRLSYLHEGRVGMDIDATVGRGVADGRVDFDVSHASFGEFKDANARVEATLKGREAAGHITASVADIGSIDVQSSSVQIGDQGGTLSMAAWRRAWGVVDAKAHVDLPKLMAQLPPDALPIRLVGGAIDLTARVDRDSMNDASPGVDVEVATTGLQLAGGAGATAWRIDGLDPTLHVTVDGDTGATVLEAGVHDAKGPIAAIDAKSTAVPYALVSSGEGLASALRAMPFDAHASISERPIESLPVALGLAGVHGMVHAGIDWHGAVTTPTIAADASIKREPGDVSGSVLPFDIVVTGHYDGAHADVTLQGSSRDKVVLDASARADAKAGDLLAGVGGAAVPWTASAKAKLDGMSLRAFTFLSDRQMRGKASGDLSIDGLHDDAHASATLTFDGLTVGEVHCRAARMQATLDGHAFDASAHVEQDDDGYVDARAHAGEHWGSALVPALDVSQAASVIASAKKLRAELLLPFVTGAFTQLDGRIDADARVDVDPAAKVARPQGTVTLTGGTFELVSLGGEFADVSGTLKLTPDGLIQLENFVAHPLTGKLEAAATARLAGLAFGGASATVQVPKTAPIPVVFEGVQMGSLDGHLDLEALPGTDRGLAVTIGAPSLHMALPDVGAHDVQQLGDLEGVSTGVHAGAAGFVEVPLDATVATGTAGPPPAPIKLDIRLGDDVQVTRGTDLAVRLQGEPIVTIAEEVTVTGQIRLVRGQISVQGKAFTIDKGTVTFVGDDPSNPQVVLTAEWTAPDQTRVYADFVGPLKTGKVTLRSDPVLPGGQNDILALLLGATTDSATGGFSNAGAGVAGGAVTQPINKALGGVNKALDKFGLAGGITANIDTTTANPRPEVAVQIARDISLQVSWVIGQRAPGTNPDTTLATLSWRFLRKWSVATTVGDAGTSIVDLIWQHRY